MDKQPFNVEYRLRHKDGDIRYFLTLQIAGRLDKDADEFIAFIVDGAARMQRMICWHIHGSVHAASRLSQRILKIYSTRQGTIWFK